MEETQVLQPTTIPANGPMKSSSLISKSGLKGTHAPNRRSPIARVGPTSHSDRHDCSPKTRTATGNILVQGNCRSPTLMVEDCSKAPFSPIKVSQLSESPQRYGLLETEDWQTLSPMREIEIHATPSSPLLTALREAVDSLSQYEDLEILEKIGAGFFAEVFKVRHIPTDQIMVLKINKRMNGLKKLKEVELLKKLSHPNILHYVGACVHEGQLHPLTEYVNGGTLEQLIQKLSVDLPWSLRLQLAADIAQGMVYLHSNGMLHRDLNSKNCLLRKQGSKYTAIVADFGLAAKSPLYRTMTRQQSVVGNPYWMAPEVLNGKLYDEKADVFSYGIILCELISRLEADPDEIPRRRDYGLDEDKFGRLPQVVLSNCPKEFMELAFLCCKLIPVERPEFSEIITRLSVISGLCSETKFPDSEDTLICPQPPERLSYHEPHRIHSPISKETAV